jgi:hypothetical protein
MPNVTIEYVIMMPLLVLQIFLFPMTANWLMNVWVDSRRTLALQDVADHLASTMQQLYFTLNHASVPVGTLTYSPGLPTVIEDSTYRGNVTLLTLAGAGINSSKALGLTVTLTGTANSFTRTVLLGPNVDWHKSVFISNSKSPDVTAEKFVNGTIALWFGQ